MSSKTIYIYMDDSGKLTSKKLCCAYGGVFFDTKKEKDRFITQFRDIIKDISNKYCLKNKTDFCCKDRTCCDKICPEIKNSSIFLEPEDRRRIMNYIKKYRTFCCFIENREVYKNILDNKASRGRYTDYAQKLVVKEIIKELIKNNVINPNEDLEIQLIIDQQTTKSNGYYTLEQGIKEELIKGIVNFDYGFKHTPILFGNLKVHVGYVNSQKCNCVQASDFVVGKSRRIYENYLTERNSSVPKLMASLNFIDIKKFLPK